MAGNILGSAFNIYGLGTGSKPGTTASTVKNPSAQYEYGQTGRLGTDTNGNGIREVDCSVLVYNGLRNSGYYLPGSNASSFTTRTLFNGDKLTHVAKDNFTTFDAASVIGKTVDLKPGDILLFEGVNGNTTQHTGIFYGYGSDKQIMFYGSQTSTGPGIVTFDADPKKVSYWNGGKSQLVGALRPNESLYVPQMDLSGGPNTGLNSPDVIAAVNLLKQSNVEGYRANIYSNVDGVPTVGNGLALVVKGSGGTWSVLPENQIKDLLRDAGLPESKYNELPLDKLSNSASLLNQGNTTAAKAQFGGGESGGFNVSPVEADKLTGAYVVRNVVPKVITTLGDSESLSFMEPGEFAALASKLYQKPGWLGTDSGKKFLDAWWEDDTSAAQSALGAGQRGQAEASAYAGNISTSNSNLSNAQSVAASATAAAKGHWEDNTAYDIMTGLPIGPENKVWVSDEPTKATTVTVTTAQIDAPDARVGNNNSPKLTITPKTPRPPGGPAGDAIDSELPDGTRIVETSTTQNGKTINTAQLKSSSGETLLSAGLGQTMERDPETGIVSVRTPGSNEVVQYDPGTNTVSKILLDDAMTGTTSGPTEPAPSTTLISAGHNDALAATNTAQRNLRSTDIANPSTSEANPSTPPTVPITPSPVSASDNTSAADDTDEFLDAIVNTFNNIPATKYHASGEVLTLANSGDGVLTDGGNVNGYSSNTVKSSALTGVNNSAQATNIAAEPEASTAVPASTGNTAQQNFRAAEITEQNTSEPVAMAASTSTNSPPNWLVDLQHVSPDFAYRLTPEQISVINNSPLAQQQISNFVNEGGQFVNGESNTGSDFTRNNGNDTIRIDSTVTGNDLLRVLSHELGHANSWLGVSGDNPVSQTWSSMREEGVAVFNEYAWNRSLIETGQTGFSMSDASGQYQLLSGYADTFGVNPVSGFSGPAGDARNMMIDNIAINIANSTPSTNLGNTYFAANYEHFLRYDPNSPLQGATSITRLQDDDGNVIFTGIKADGTPVSVNVPPVTSVQLSIDDNGNINIVGVRNDGSSIGFVGSAHGEGTTTTTITPAGGSPAPAIAADLNTGSVDTIASAVIPNATENQPVVILNTTTDAPNTVATPVSPVEPPQVIDRLGNSFDASTANNLTNATGYLALGSTLLTLQNWADASDLSRAQTAVSLYNQINSLSKLDMPSMSGVGSVLSFYSACQNGDAGGIAYSGLQMVDTLTSTAATELTAAIPGWIGAIDPNIIPGLGLLLALTKIEENPLGVITAALNFFPPAGPFIGAFLNIIQTVFTPAPVSEGEAHATFDEFGHLNIITDSEKNGGGGTSSYWMDRLAQGAQLNGIQTPQAGAYVMGMPTIGYKYNPDGFNYENANGHLTLRWIGADGQSYTRTYDANGSRDGDPADASNQGGITDIERDFQKLMHSSAKQYPPLAYEQLEGGILQLDYGVATVVYAVNTHKFDGMAEHTHGGDEDTDASQDPAIEIGEGDKRLLQDDSNTIANSSKQTHVKVAASNLHTVVAPIIAPIQTKGDLIGAGSNKVVSNGVITRPLGFVPLGGTDSLSQEKKSAIAAMIKSADNGLFGANNITSTAMAAAAVIQWPSLASAGVPNATNLLPAAERRYGVSDLRPWPYSSEVGNGSGADNNGSANKVQEIVRPTLTSNPAGKGTVQQNINAIDASTVQLGNIIGDAPASTANGYLIPAGIAASSLSGEGAEAFRATGKASDLILTYPKVTGELVAGTEDTGLRFSSEMLLVNDSTDNGRAYSNMPSLRISAVGSPTHGQVALKDGQVIFIPDANFHGTATFKYTVTDQFGLSSVVTASIFVEAVNDAPITAGESATANEDNIQVFSAASLLANDWDDDGATDGQSLSIVAVQGATHGTVTLENGQIKFIPDANYHGPASFTYMVSDGITQIPTTVNLTITAVNDAPVTKDEAATGDEDVVMVYSQAALLANDSDVDTATDGDVLRISRVGNASHGTVTMDANGDIRFVPDANFHGQASYTYWVSDGQTETPATMHVTLDAVNDAPVTTDETATASEDATLMFTSAALLANDGDVDTATDGDVLSISSVGQAEHGMVFLDANGDVRFVPDANYNGPASYTYWVTDGRNGLDGVQPVPATVNLNILQVNDLPVVTGELIASDEDVVLSIAPSLLLANDRDIDTDATLNQAAGALQTLTISAVGGAQHGTVVLLADGTVQFTPEPNYFGAASFTYTVDDGEGGQVQATAVVNLAPVNDAPDVVGETISINEDEIQTISTAALLANDSDVDNPHADLRIVAVDSLGAATHGTVTLNTNGTISYVPDADYFGPAQFTYTVSDGAGGFNVGTADLNIAAVNDAPRLQGESTTTDEDQILHISKASLLANDHDVDNPDSVLAITGVSNASHGTVSMVGTEIVFTPDLNYNGAASFSYTVSDGVGGTSLATVSLTINSVNDAPVVNDELLIGKRDHTYTLSQAALLSNDTDVETPRANLTIVEVKNVQNGTAILNADHSVTFAPNAGYAGRGTFEYVVQDADGGQTTGTSYIDFSAVNINPIAVNDSVAGYQDARTEISTAQLLSNDSDPDGSAATTLTVDQVGNAQNGSVTLGADGIVRFQPNPGFYGGASFDYRINDSEGGLTTATAFVTVQRANQAPVFDFTTGDNGNQINATLLHDGGVFFGHPNAWLEQGVDPWRHQGTFAAHDPDGDPITYSIEEFSPSGQVLQGHAYINQYLPDTTTPYLNAAEVGPYLVQADGYWQYIAHEGSPFDGLDTFYLVATDSHGAEARAQITTHHKSSTNGLPDNYSWDFYSGFGYAPVVIDLEGNGLDLLKAADSKMLVDINGDGWKDRIGWAAPSDAVLVFDKNQDGLANISDEVSFTSYVADAKTDLEGLVAFDTDGDGKITANDQDWGKFGLLQDKNDNGLQDEGEFLSLDQQGITSIDLHRVGTPEMNNGNVVFGTSEVKFADGHTTQAGDVMFAGKDIALPQDVLALIETDVSINIQAGMVANQDVITNQVEKQAIDENVAAGKYITELERIKAEEKIAAEKEAAELLAAVEQAKAEAKLVADRDEEVRLAEIAAKEAAEKLAAEQAEQLAIQQAKEAAEALAAAQAQAAAEAAAQALAAQQAAEAQAAAVKAAEEAAKEAALAEEAELRRQALLFNQMVNTNDSDATPIAFVPSNDAVTGHINDPSGLHTQAANDEQLNATTLTGTR